MRVDHGARSLVTPFTGRSLIMGGTSLKPEALDRNQLVIDWSFPRTRRQWQTSDTVPEAESLGQSGGTRSVQGGVLCQ